MAMTNAISGMTIVGGMLQLGGGLFPGTIPQVLAAGAGMIRMLVYWLVIFLINILHWIWVKQDTTLSVYLIYEFY